jgi:hypothetical protein
MSYRLSSPSSVCDIMDVLVEPGETPLSYKTKVCIFITFVVCIIVLYVILDKVLP